MIRAFFDRWVWTMALRDARRSRARLILPSSALVLGVAALVAVTSFSTNVGDAFAEQSRELLGADLVVRSRQPFDEGTDAQLLHRFAAGGERSDVVTFNSMALLPRTGASRLVRVRAVRGGFPFYGALATDPPAAAARFAAGEGALLDASLIANFQAKPGDAVKIGDREYAVLGTLQSAPGESATSSLMGAPLYLPLEGLDPSLLERGVRVDYSAAFRLAPGQDAEELRSGARELAQSADVRIDTARSTAEGFGNSMANFHAFLNLIAFLALLLGALGVGSAMHVHAQARRDSVATLRCLGADAARACAIYLAQALMLALLGALAGGALGVVLHRSLPALLADFLPVAVPVRISPRALLLGGCIGGAASLLAALVPLLPLRRAPPLLALRSAAGLEPPRRDPWRAAVLVVFFLLVLVFARFQLGDLRAAAGYALGMLACFGILLALGRATIALLRRGAGTRAPFAWRQGVASLHRPNNQTGLLLIAIGFATLMLGTVAQLRALLLASIEEVTGGTRANLALYDVQDDQLEGAIEVIRAAGAPVLESTPIVTIRLESVNGRRVEELRLDQPRRSSALTREYRATYRDRLSDSERVVAGEWPAARTPGAPAPISLEDEQAARIGADVGDTLVWNVAGESVPTAVAALRHVDWRRFTLNFFVVFHSGVLEQAPKFHAVLTRVEDAKARGELQSAVIARFPSISAIDITLVLETIDDLLAKVAFVVRFLALFCVAMGLLVLLSSVLQSRARRAEESTLLRTLGASRALVDRIVAIEFATLGLVGATAGGALALGATWLLARWRFDLVYRVAWPELAATVLIVAALTYAVGRFGARGIERLPPLRALD